MIEGRGEDGEREGEGGDGIKKLLDKWQVVRYTWRERERGGWRRKRKTMREERERERERAWELSVFVLILVFYIKRD